MEDSPFVHKESHRGNPNIENSVSQSINGSYGAFTSLDHKTSLNSKLKDVLGSNGPIWK